MSFCVCHVCVIHTVHFICVQQKYAEFLQLHLFHVCIYDYDISMMLALYSLKYQLFATFLFCFATFL